MTELKDYMDQYTLIDKTKITLHKSIDDNDIRLIYGDFKRLYIIDKNDLNGEIRNYMHLARVPKTIYGDSALRFYNYYADVLVNPYVGLRTMQEMRDEPIETIRNNNLLINHRTNLWNAKVWVQLEREYSADSNDKEYFVSYYMNKKIINNMCDGKKEPSGSLLLELLGKVVKANKMRENNNQLEIIKSEKNVAKPFSFENSANESESYNLTENYSLYEYQKSDVQWMKHIEHNVETGNNEIQFSYSPITHVLDGKLVLFNNILLPRWLISDNVVDCKDSFRYLGGNLISEMGLGKTIVCFSHIFSDLENDQHRDKVNQFVSFKSTCNYCFKRGRNRGKMCDNEVTEGLNSLYCKAHSNSAFYDKRALDIINKDAFNINDFLTPGETKFKTNATLIIAPNQLCDQWVNEYLTKFVSDKRVVMIVTYDQYENLQLADLLFADVVITSYQFISNLHVMRGGIDKARLEESGIDVLNSGMGLSLHNFAWKRLILDEVHELGKIARSKAIITFISELQSQFKWNVSGTPFANGLLGFYLLMGLNTTLRGECLHMDERSDYIMNSLPLFRRNSKESIKNEFSGNIIKEHYKFLTFTQAERSIYDGYLLNSKAYNFLIQICCHTELFNETKELIKNCKTFEEIQEVLVDWNKNQLDILVTTVNRLERSIAEKIEQVNNETDDVVLEELRGELGTLRKNYTINKKTVENVGRTYNYLKYTLESLKDNVENECCPICLDTIEQDKLTITKCGHRFCVDCISKVTNDSYVAKCPQCNQHITQRDVYVLKNAPNNDNEEKGKDTLEGIISRVKSTKVGNIIHFLRNIDPNDKVIVFSQWDEILKKVGHYLTEYKLNHVFCTGTVYQKKGAIKNFSTKNDVNIIMLSSKNAASGINLTAANKIVLIEPVYGTDEYRESIEAQAIGRADRIGQKRPIDVYRFIIKDTVEEEIVSVSEQSV